LVEARRRAGANIDRWGAMVSLTRQLAKEAEVTIETPQRLLTDIAKARSDLDKADYLAALKIGERASDAQTELKGRAKQRLASAERERAAAVATINNDIARITATRDANCVAANNAKQAAINDAERMRTSVSAPYFDLKEKAQMGCVAGFVIIPGWVVSIFVLDILFGKLSPTANPQLGDTIFKIFTTVFVVFGLFGWLTIPVIAAINRAIKHSFKQSEAASNASALVKKAERSSKIAVTQAEKDFARDIVAPQSALPKAEVHWQKAVQAINRLQQSN
jgi:hypothetical protein